MNGRYFVSIVCTSIDSMVEIDHSQRFGKIHRRVDGSQTRSTSINLEECLGRVERGKWGELPEQEALSMIVQWSLARQQHDKPVTIAEVW